MTKEQALSLFSLSEIPVLGIWELKNQYHLSSTESWWLVKTHIGLIEIGWRKRVISIDWSDSKFSCTVTNDDVTIGSFHVHAWSYAKAIEYLTELKNQRG